MKKRTRSSLAKRNLVKFMGNRMAVIGVVILLVIVLSCICAPLLTPYSPNLIDLSQKGLPCSSEHLLGTDRMGRDLLARVLYGGRMSIFIGVASALGATLLGSILGCISGFYGGIIDRVLVYVAELFQSFPQYLLILLCVGLLGQSTKNLLLIFIFTGWPVMMRIVRSRLFSLKQEPFIESCRANGVSSASIMFHHLLPNTLGPVIVNVTLQVAQYILSEASLSFLGMGVPDTVVTWGNIINAAKRLDIIQTMPLLWVAPGIAICLFVLSINFFGDGLRDVLDPSAQ
ncbi:MAG: ABC transporter permease [Oscillospiraceae bacterium]|nr:ABC transporter permease [Oscillospiraceae bacterium]